jgi:hypothetical protein
MSEHDQEEPLYEPRVWVSINPFRPRGDRSVFYLRGINQPFMWNLNEDNELPDPEDIIKFVENFLSPKKEENP